MKSELWHKLQKNAHLVCTAEQTPKITYVEWVLWKKNYRTTEELISNLFCGTDSR